MKVLNSFYFIRIIVNSNRNKLQYQVLFARRMAEEDVRKISSTSNNNNVDNEKERACTDVIIDLMKPSDDSDIEVVDQPQPEPPSTSCNRKRHSKDVDPNPNAKIPCRRSSFSTGSAALTGDGNAGMIVAPAEDGDINNVPGPMVVSGTLSGESRDGDFMADAVGSHSEDKEEEREYDKMEAQIARLREELTKATAEYNTLLAFVDQIGQLGCARAA